MVFKPAIHPAFALYFDHDEQIILERRGDPAGAQYEDRLRKAWTGLRLPSYDD